jgi:GMP synthase (glutamine-hydrolysing)
MNLKILLLQARHKHDKARHEERQSFADRAGLDLTQIVPHDLLESPPTLAQIRQYDALMVGGSGAYSVFKQNLPDQPAVLEVLAEVVDVGHPTFASCFGFQLLVTALGGKVIYDPDCMEVGTYELSTTEDGRVDELFNYLPSRFNAQLGHKDRAKFLPAGAINLASSYCVEYQALRIPGKPIWATQFHPEMTGQENRIRFDRYVDQYASIYSPEELKAVLDRFAGSPEADQLIPRFLKTVFG